MLLSHGKGVCSLVGSGVVRVSTSRQAGCPIHRVRRPDVSAEPMVLKLIV